MNPTERCVHNLIAPPKGLHDQLMTLILYRQRLDPRNKPFTPGDLQEMYRLFDLQAPTEKEIRSYLEEAQHCYHAGLDDHFHVRDGLPNIWQERLADCFNPEVGAPAPAAQQTTTNQNQAKKIDWKNWAKDHPYAAWLMLILGIVGAISIFK